MNLKLLFASIIIAFSTCLQTNIQCNKVPKDIIDQDIINYVTDGREQNIVFESRESIDNPTKIKRSGLLITRPNAKATVLICHGFMCDKFDINFFHLIFKNCNTLTFDFRAHGEDIDNQVCTFGRNESYDVRGAVNFIKNHKKLSKLPLIIYGFSMGAVSSIVAASIDPKLCDALILDCPFDSSDKLLERGLSCLKFNLFGYQMSIPGSSLFKNYAYNPYIQSMLKALLKTYAKMDSTDINTCIAPIYPEEAIKYVKIPVFIIGSTNDNKAPEEAVISVYKGAKGYKRLWICHARRHFDSVFYKMNEYIYRINEFIDDILSKSYHQKVQQGYFIDPKVQNPSLLAIL